MSSRRGTPKPIHILAFGLAALAVILGCRAGDLLTGIRQSRVGVTPVAVGLSRPGPSATSTEVALAEPATEATSETPTEGAIETPTEGAVESPTGGAVEAPTGAPTETLEPSSTELPTETPEPAESDTPRPTRTPAPPTRIPPPTETFTPPPPPTPTRCPDQFCVIKTDCIPGGGNTRAIGHVYQNGVLVNGIRVRVSYDNGGAPAAGDFISGHDPVNPQLLWPGHEGYYQVGIAEGAAQDGNWWVFLVDQGGHNQISEGRWFKTANVTTDNSCNVGVTDFGG